MWFKPKTEDVQPKLDAKDVWSALQSHRSLDQQRRYILELETRLHKAEGGMRTAILLLSCIVVVLTLITGWNTYQVHTWRHQVEETVGP